MMWYTNNVERDKNKVEVITMMNYYKSEATGQVYAVDYPMLYSVGMTQVSEAEYIAWCTAHGMKP